MNPIKTALGVAALGLGAIGSGFTARPLITAGWYGASNGDVTKQSGMSPYQLSDFPDRIGNTKPLPNSSECTTHANYVCAAYFNTNGINTNDPVSHEFYVTGDYQN